MEDRGADQAVLLYDEGRTFPWEELMPYIYFFSYLKLNVTLFFPPKFPLSVFLDRSLPEMKICETLH